MDNRFQPIRQIFIGFWPKQSQEVTKLVRRMKDPARLMAIGAITGGKYARK
jgi:hypothetical protein